jgi:hypothetical protein
MLEFCCQIAMFHLVEESGFAASATALRLSGFSAVSA